MSRGPDLARREVWRRRLREFDRGEDTVAEFCRRTCVSVASFYQWRRKLAAIVSSETKTPRVPATAMSFLPVEITPPRGSVVEVLLPNGARVLVPSGEREALRAVIEAAASIQPEARAC
jgi:hypothetical protein